MNNQKQDNNLEIILKGNNQKILKKENLIYGNIVNFIVNKIVIFQVKQLVHLEKH